MATSRLNSPQLASRTESIWSLSPNYEKPAQLSLKSDYLMCGWMRYRRKYHKIFQSVKLFQRFSHLGLFKWSRCFVILTKDMLLLYKNEDSTSTFRNINLTDIDRLENVTDISGSTWCLRVLPTDNTVNSICLAAHSEENFVNWMFEIKQQIMEHKGLPLKTSFLSINEKLYYCTHADYMNEVDESGPYADIIETDVKEPLFNSKGVTFVGTRDDLIKLFANSGKNGDYVIRFSRHDDKIKVLSIKFPNEIRDFIIIEKENSVSLDDKIIFANLKELLNYYVINYLPAHSKYPGSPKLFTLGNPCK